MMTKQRSLIEVRLFNFLPERPHRATAPLGRSHTKQLAQAVERAEFDEPPGLLVNLNFQGIESATGSYLKETILQPLLWAGATPTGESGVSGEPPRHFYPVLCGLNDELREDIDDMLALRRLFCLEVLEWNGAANDVPIAVAALRGGSDRFVSESLRALQEHGPAAAAEIQSATGGKITVNGWNNRLYDLYRLRLARRFKRERQWIYRSLAEEIEFKEGTL